MVEAVDKAIDTPVQQINDKQYYDLPKRFQSLGVLFEFIEKNYYDFDSVDL